MVLAATVAVGLVGGQAARAAFVETHTSLGLTFSEGADPALFAESYVGLEVSDPVSGDWRGGAAQILARSPSGTPGGDTWTQDGLLVFVVDLNDGESLDFLALADGVVGVAPFPAPVWLSGSALFALGFIGRRKPRARGIGKDRRLAEPSV